MCHQHGFNQEFKTQHGTGCSQEIYSSTSVFLGQGRVILKNNHCIILVSSKSPHKNILCACEWSHYAAAPSSFPLEVWVQLPIPKSAISSSDKNIELLQSSQERNLNSTGVNRFCKHHHYETRQAKASLFYWWGGKERLSEILSVSLYGSTQKEESKSIFKSLVESTLWIRKIKDHFILKKSLHWGTQYSWKNPIHHILII